MCLQVWGQPSAVEFEKEKLDVDSGLREAQPADDDGGQRVTICGFNDNRSASTSRDDAAGRICFPTRNPPSVHATAFIASNGALLTAGHVVDADNDGAVDGAFLGAVVEFDVPASTSAGVTNPELSGDDVYAIDPGVVPVFRRGGLAAQDWGVFAVLPNANTGRFAGVDQGFYRLRVVIATAGTTIRVAGYGNDNRPAG
ncbi:MAG: hypothetical protein IH987_08920, partial [Planctomycetes bacterium]|nr:hypothetical protein [Planctomycetota bacterium]